MAVGAVRSYAPEALQAEFDTAMLALDSDRQRRFVTFLLADPDENATKAAIRAGYSKKTATVQASQTLRYLKVQIALTAGRRMAIWSVMNVDELRARLALRSRSSMDNVTRLPSIEPPDTPAEEPELPEDLTDADAIKAVIDKRVEIRLEEAMRRSSWSLDLVKAQKTGGIHQIKKLKRGKYGIEVEMYDPLPAKELLARINKLLGDETGILKFLDLTKLNTEQLQRIADGEDPLRVILTSPTESPGPA